MHVVGFSLGCVVDPFACAGGKVVGSVVGSVGGSVAKSVASTVVGTIAGAVQSAAGWVLAHVIGLAFSNGFAPHLDSQWFEHVEGRMIEIAAVVTVPIVLVASIGPVLRQDLRGLGRVWGVGLPVAALAGGAAIAACSLALNATDALCSMVSAGATQALGARVSGLIAAGLFPGVPSMILIALGILVIFGAVALWFELILRSAAVYIAAFFLPLALAGFVWPATTKFAKRAVELVVALVLSKFVIVATLVLGSAAIPSTPSVDAGVVAAAILLLAAFAPFVLLRLVPIVEVAAISNLEGQARRPLRAAASVPAAAVNHPAVQLLLNSSRASGPPSPADVTSQPLAERAAAWPLGDEGVRSNGQRGDG